MQASNNGTPTGHAQTAAAEALLLAAMRGACGFSVRCTPGRITRMVDWNGGVAFAKVRVGRPADARREWRWLRELPRIGLPTPEPIAFVQRGRATALLIRGVGGRPLDAFFREANDAAEFARVVAFAVRAVAPKVAALHRSGLVYRDLYWGHVVTDGVEARHDATFLDVERVFAPRLWFERWRTKDLAGLASSFPGEIPLRAAVRFLRAYLAADAGLANGRGAVRELLRRAAGKALRIRAHAPRFG